MGGDIVVDTNVLLHAGNAVEQRREDALRFIEFLIKKSEIHLCIDDGYAAIEADNRSVIGSEYYRHLAPGGLGAALIEHLAKSGRIRVVEKRVPAPIGRAIRQHVPKPVDRTFVKVAFNSDDRLLVSHDYEDFSPACRASLKKKLDVTICDAAAAMGVLQ